MRRLLSRLLDRLLERPVTKKNHHGRDPEPVDDLAWTDQLGDYCTGPDGGELP